MLTVFTENAYKHITWMQFPTLSTGKYFNYRIYFHMAAKCFLNHVLYLDVLSQQSHLVQVPTEQSHSSLEIKELHTL